MNPRDERYVLHPSIPVLWWLRHLETSTEATNFLHQSLLLGDTRVIAIQDLRWETLQAVADDLGGSRLAGTIADMLISDVTSVFQRLGANQIVRLEARERLERESFALAAAFDVPLTDADYAIPADRVDLPLLVASTAVAARYRPIADDRAALRVLTLSEYFTIT